MKLLIVDDHADARDVIRSYVNHLASEVRECASGDQAIAACRQFDPDVMTLDLRIGAEDGVPVLEFVRAHFPLVHILVVTQFRQPAIAGLVTRLGAAACFSKSELVELRSYLEGVHRDRQHAAEAG